MTKVKWQTPEHLILHKDKKIRISHKKKNKNQLHLHENLFVQKSKLLYCPIKANRGEDICDPGLRNLGKIQSAQTLTKQFNKFNYIKIKSCSSKDK